ncbi:MAG: hypothetical protein ACFFCD_13415 [Promethearchaeota archaeon]
MEDDASLNEAALEVAEKASRALEKLIFSTGTPEEVLEELMKLNVTNLLEENWKKFTSDPKYYYHLDILQTVLTLQDELLNQLEEMGVDSIKADLENLDFAREKIANK